MTNVVNSSELFGRLIVALVDHVGVLKSQKKKSKPPKRRTRRDMRVYVRVQANEGEMRVYTGTGETKT